MLIDPGLAGEVGLNSLTASVAATGYRLADVAGVVITHAHLDHHGLSAAVIAESGGWMAMHAAEAQLIDDRAERGIDESDDRNWLAGWSVPGVVQDEMRPNSDLLDAVLRATPATVRLTDDALLPLADHRVRAVHTPGHTPGHLCLFHEGEQLFFSGDHVLPKISPHVGLQSRDTPAPLGSYIASLRKVRAFDSAEVLPGHEWRFTGLAARVDQLLAHHERRCAEIVDRLDTPEGVTAWDLTTRLTWSRGWSSIHGRMRRTALAETLAHLEHLKENGQIMQVSDDTQARFVAVG